jgi:hypothetical protein
MIYYSKIDGSPDCECHRCTREKTEAARNAPANVDSGVDVFFGIRSKMILCPICGNKRCPHASDHRLACTNSNDPGQPGSVY